MSALKRISITAAFLLLSCHYQTLLAQNSKHALIIAIGDYDKSVTGWNSISSLNDVPLIKGALIAQGFDEPNIKVLENQEATKKGIEKAIEGLIETAQEGDIVLIHYSGHGQQITDDNGDEIDGYDEAIVPIDARSRFEKGVYEGENHMRDDEIGESLLKLRKKVGANGSVLLIMDSCHSGTASRGLAKARGTQELFVTSGTRLSSAKQEDGLFGLNPEEPDKTLAPLICLYGASAHELNYEAKDADGHGVGSLSLAFSDAFAKSTNSQTYAELFDQVKNKMATIAPRQTPQAEGDLNRLVLGGKIEGRKPYYKVIEALEDNLVIINGGTLMGLYEGSEVSLYPLGEEPVNENLVAIGTITYADATTCDVALNEGVKPSISQNSKAYITQVNYGSMSVSVALNLSDTQMEASLLEAFIEYPLIKVVEHQADLVVEESSGSRGAEVVLSTTQEYELYKGDMETQGELVKGITKSIVAFAQANFLRTIAMENEDLNVSFEFVPIEATQAGRGRWKETARLNINQKQDVSGNINFVDGDFFKIKMVNNGFEVAYVSILDFQPDNVINVLVPGKYKSPTDYVIKPGEEIELPDVFRFGPPFGTEVFKLVATKEPVDFRSILVSKGQTRGEETKNPFAQLVASSFKEDSGTRGSETMNVQPGSCNIYSVTFNISSPK